ncbi:MAG: exonuclease domain-containing protein [Salibacteraceae bacterium]
MKLNLQRPLAFIDLETTGTQVAKDRIVEIAILKVQPDGSQTVKTLRINPEQPIPAESSAIHGISDADVANEPTFKDVAGSLFKFLFECDLAGFNSNKFDIPLLVEEFERAGITFEVEGRKLVDVQNIFHKMEQRTLSAAFQFYCGENLENAHSAEADIRATFEVLRAQIERYDNLENDMDFLHEFSRRNNNVDLAGRFVYNDKKEVLFNFGKHRGRLVTDVLRNEPGYYGWMLQGDFPSETKRVLKAVKESMAASNRF